MMCYNTWSYTVLLMHNSYIPSDSIRPELYLHWIFHFRSPRLVVLTNDVVEAAKHIWMLWQLSWGGETQTHQICVKRGMQIHSKMGELVMLQEESRMAEIHIQTKVANIYLLPSQPSSFSLFLLFSPVFQKCLPHLIPDSVWVLPQVQDVNSGDDCCLCALPLHCLVCQSLSTQHLITLARWLQDSLRTEGCEGQRVSMRGR